MSTAQDEPQPWYANKVALRSAIAKSLGGYKGQIEKRWHLTPLSWIDISTQYACTSTPDDSEDDDGEDDDGEDDEEFLTKQGCAGLLPPDDSILRQRIRRLREMLIENGDMYSMDDFSHISFDIEDADGQIFEFDMIFNEGCADANTGFYAVVWERSTGDEVAHCTTICDSVTKIVWTKKSLIDRYVPHPGLCPPTVDKFLSSGNFDEPKYRDFFDFCLVYSGLHCTYDDDKNQLELLMAVAAKLTDDKYAIYYPKIVPSEVLDAARVSYAEDVLKLSMPRDALKLTLGYISSNFYLDDDSPLSRCGLKRKINALD